MEYVRFAARRARALIGLEAIAWVFPVLVLLVAAIFGGGVEALRDNVLVMLLLIRVGLVVGHALVVPAMFRVLHFDMAWRTALRRSIPRWGFHSLLGSPVIFVPLVAVSLWPEIWGTVSEVFAVQAVAAMPFILLCQFWWMQTVAEESDIRDVASDVRWLLAKCGGEIAMLLVPAYLVLFALLGSNLVVHVTVPVAFILVSVPFTAWQWMVWMRVVGSQPAWSSLPARDRVAPAAATPQTTAPQVPATQAAVAQPQTAQVVTLPVTRTGNGLLTHADGQLAGMWVNADETDTFTCTVRVPDGLPDDSRAWGVYLYRHGCGWRELELLWNDGRHIVAHGLPRGRQSFVGVRRHDGVGGVPFQLWVNVATGRAASAGPGDAVPAQVAA
jgi:hypothetical protein